MNDLRPLKDEGHLLIDELVSLGMKQEQIYQKIKSQMKKTQGYHFSQMKTLGEVRKAIHILKKMRDAKINKQNDKLKEITLPREERLKALANLPKRPIPWHRKLWIKIKYLCDRYSQSG